MIVPDVKPRTKQKLKLLAGIVAASAVAGLGYSTLLGQLLEFDVTLDVLWRFAVQGVLLGAIFGAAQLFYFQGEAGERFRRLPIIVEIIGKGLISTGLLTLALFLGAVLLFRERFALEGVVSGFVRDILFAFAIAMIIQFVLTVRTMIGGRVLGNLLVGHYHRPVREERIFMFLDIAGSTAIAERLGDVAAHSLISQFFFDVAQPTAAFGGETHSYIGDEVIITWPMAEGLRDAACLKCCFAIAERFNQRAQSYRDQFGLVPDYRIGLHGGPVVAGECGDDKREIVYIGDTVNTTARIQEYCKKASRNLLISGDLAERLILPAEISVERIDSVQLRGKAKGIEIFAANEST